MDAALLGQAAQAAAYVVARANTGPAPGYRFPAFMPQEQVNAFECFVAKMHAEYVCPRRQNGSHPLGLRTQQRPSRRLQQRTDIHAPAGVCASR